MVSSVKRQVKSLSERQKDKVWQKVKATGKWARDRWKGVNRKKGKARRRKVS